MNQCIIYLHPHFTSAGGAGRLVLETGKRLSKRGYKVYCVCIRADPEIVRGYEEIQFRSIGGPLSSSIFFWLGFRSVCQRVQKQVQAIVADHPTENCVLFPQVFPANWWGSFVSTRMPKLDCIWYCHEPSAFIHSTNWIDALPWPKNWLGRLLNPILRRIDLQSCKKFTHILVNSHFSKDYTCKVYGYNDPMCEVVYPGFDRIKFHPAIEGSRQRSFICVAKLTRFKNVDRVIDAMRVLSDRGDTQTQLHIVGSGDEKVNLQKQTSRLGLDKRVLFHGRVDDSVLVKLLQGSQGLCLVSVEEPFGLVAIEAMGCGTPVIAVNSGGPAEIVGQSSAGILIDQPNPELIANAMETLLQDSQSSYVRSSAAIARAAEFDWESMADKLDRLFRS